MEVASSSIGAVLGQLWSPLAPVFYSVFTAIIAKIICPAFLKRPFQDLNNPMYYEVRNAENIRIGLGRTGEDLGAWLIKPHHQDNPSTSDEVVILYLHGNCETRSASHRVGLYHVLQKMGFTVLAIDYRGFGDSSYLISPNETSMVEDAIQSQQKIFESVARPDAIQSFNYLKSNLRPEAKVVVWGHSLGTGVTSKMGALLAKEKFKPDAYVLEAPFNSIHDAVMTSKFAHLFAYLGIDIPRVVKETGLEFESQRWVAQIPEPVMIFHSEDDYDVPYHLGQTLYSEVKSSKKNIEMKSFTEAGHNYMYTEDRLKTSFQDFINRHIN